MRLRTILAVFVCGFIAASGECRAELIFTSFTNGAAAIGALGATQSANFDSIQLAGLASVQTSLTDPDPLHLGDVRLTSYMTSHPVPGGFGGHGAEAFEIELRSPTGGSYNMSGQSTIQFAITTAAEYRFDAVAAIEGDVPPDARVLFELINAGPQAPINLRFSTPGESEIRQHLFLEEGQYRFSALHSMFDDFDQSISGSARLKFSLREASLPEPRAIVQALTLMLTFAFALRWRGVLGTAS